VGEYLLVDTFIFGIPFLLSTSAGWVALMRKRRKLGIALIMGGLVFTIVVSLLSYWALFAEVDACESRPYEKGVECLGPAIIVLPFMPALFSLVALVATWAAYIARLLVTRRAQPAVASAG
jgi:hypothetical protein